MKLSQLCEQDKILQELETRIRTLKEDKVFLSLKWSLFYLFLYNFYVCMRFLVFCLCFSCPYLGHAGVCSGCLTPPDGAIQRSASPCWKDCLSAEVITRGCCAHQGRNIQILYSKTQVLYAYIKICIFSPIAVYLVSAGQLLFNDKREHLKT